LYHSIATMQALDIERILNDKQFEWVNYTYNHYSKASVLVDLGLFDKDYYFGRGDNVALIRCFGANVSDAQFTFLIRNEIGNEGKLITIDRSPHPLYKRAKCIFDKYLTKTKEYYLTPEGAKEICDMFDGSNIIPFVQEIPPFPKEIKDESLDTIFTLDLEYLLRINKDDRSIPERLFLETYKKLKKDGTLIVHADFPEDIPAYCSIITKVVKEHNLAFAPDVLDFLETMPRAEAYDFAPEYDPNDDVCPFGQEKTAYGLMGKLKKKMEENPHITMFSGYWLVANKEEGK